MKYLLTFKLVNLIAKEIRQTNEAKKKTVN